MRYDEPMHDWLLFVLFVRVRLLGPIIQLCAGGEGDSEGRVL